MAVWFVAGAALHNVAQRRNAMPDQNEYRFPGPPSDGAAGEVITPAEATHWIEVYSQLINFEEGVLAGVREMIVTYPPDVRRAVQETNVEPLEVLISQCRERLAFWQRQHLSVLPDEAGSPE